MCEVINFPHAAGEKPKLHPAVLRLQGLATVTSELNGMNLRNQDDIERALWILDLTNRCIKIILSNFRGDPSMEKLIKLAGELADSVERARRMLHRLAFTLSRTSVRRH